VHTVDPKTCSIPISFLKELKAAGAAIEEIDQGTLWTVNLSPMGLMPIQWLLDNDTIDPQVVPIFASYLDPCSRTNRSLHPPHQLSRIISE